MHEMAINFTEGFSHGHVIWGWMIGVYLVLAGMSGGALTIALVRRHYAKDKKNTGLLKGAAIIGFGTIAFGMVFLVADLHRPLYFWKILINYNFTSVMSIGVAAISIYIPLTLMVFLMALEDEIKDFLQNKIKIPFIKKSLMDKIVTLITFITDILKKFRSSIEFTTIFFAIVICVYTGFLISVLVRFPLLNTAVLPILFMVSGLAAGAAATRLLTAGYYRLNPSTFDESLLHRLEWPIMFLEILLIAMLVVSLMTGIENQKYALDAFNVVKSEWAYLFWIGVVGVGFGIPLSLNFLFGSKVAHSSFTMYASGFSTLLGVLCLRVFLLYAGQSFGV